MIALQCDVCGRIYQTGVNRGFVVEDFFHMCHLCKSLLWTNMDFSKEFVKRLKEIDRLSLSLLDDMRKKAKEFPPQLKANIFGKDK